MDSRSRGELPILAGLGLAIAAAILSLAVLPVQVLAGALGALLLLILLAASVAFPPTLVYFVLLTSPFSGLVRELDEIQVAGRSVSLSGLRWLAVAGALIGVLILTRRPVRVPRAMIPLFLFGVWAGYRLIGSGEFARGVGDVIFYLLPPLLAVFTVSVVHDRPRHHGVWIGRVILGSIFVPLVLYCILLPAGLVQWTRNGPKGILGPRPVATFLVIALCMSLAVWCHGATRRARKGGMALSMLAVGLILFTASRMASVTAMLLLVLFSLDPRRWWRLFPRIAAGGLAVLVVLLSVPQLRDRLVHRVPRDLREVSTVAVLSGRDTMWRATFEHALGRPLVGWGPGSSRPLVAQSLEWRGRDDPPREYPPHNEYLQVLHDTGAVGLLLLLLAWTVLGLHYLRGWRRAVEGGDGELCQWHLASVLGIGVVLMNSLVDNTLHYTTVTGPLFVILGCTTGLATGRGAAGGGQIPPAEAPAAPPDAEVVG